MKIAVEMGTPKRAGLRAVELPFTLVVPADLLTPLPVKGGYEVRDEAGEGQGRAELEFKP